MSESESEKGSTNWKGILLNGSLLLLGAIIGAYFSYRGVKQSAEASAQAQIAAAQEAAKAEITSMAISVLVPMQATQTAEARATPVPMRMVESPAATPSPAPTMEPGYLEIEQLPQHVFVFAGNNNPDGGYGVFDLFYEESSHPIYQMTYSLPSDKYGYAGMVFQFPDGVDLSDYREIEFSLHFQHPGDKIELYIRDIGSHNNSVLIGGSGQDEMKLSYAFANFPEINFSAVKEIGWIASTTYAQGDYTVQVQDVRLVK